MLVVDAVSKQDDSFVRLAEREDLEDVHPRVGCADVADVHAHRDVRPGFQELHGVEPAAALVVLCEEVDHLPAVPSGRRRSRPAAARDAQPLRVLDEEVPEVADVPSVERRERLPETLSPITHAEEDTRVSGR